MTLTGGQVSSTPFEGGAVHAEGDSCTITIIGSTIKGNSATRGGGVYSRKGSCIIEDSKLYSNKANKGAGLFITNNTCTLKGSTKIQKNVTPKEEGTKGGGIFVGVKGTCVIEAGVQIIENRADYVSTKISGFGGGIYIEAEATVKIIGTAEKSVVISGNEGKNGGGVYMNGGTLDITHAEIKDHLIETNNYGGGIYIKGGDATLFDSVVSNNTSLDNNAKGVGIYIDKNGSFTLKGSSVVTPASDKNDVYLGTGRTIHISGDLTSSGKAARITPQSYPSGSTAVQVLSGDITTGSNYDKFTVTPSSGMQQWRVDSNGKLVSQ